jgi:hypothetical protein
LDTLARDLSATSAGQAGQARENHP